MSFWIVSWLVLFSWFQGKPSTSTSNSDSDRTIASPDDLYPILNKFLSVKTSSSERRQIWGKVCNSGLLGQTVEAFEKRAKENPNNPDTFTDLGMVYLEVILTLPDGPEKGQWAMKADKCFDSALVSDNNHWQARFIKAVALASWPPIFKKQGDAIQQLETLLAQQELEASKPEFVRTYEFLGTLHQQQGNLEQAKAIWQKGLKAFPKDRAIADLLDGSAKGRSGDLTTALNIAWNYKTVGDHDLEENRAVIISQIPSDLSATERSRFEFLYSLSVWERTRKREQNEERERLIQEGRLKTEKAEISSFAEKISKAEPSPDSIVGSLQAERGKDWRGGVCIKGSTRMLPMGTKLRVSIRGALDIAGKMITSKGETEAQVDRAGNFTCSPFLEQSEFQVEGEYLVEVFCMFNGACQTKDILQQLGVVLDSQGRSSISTNPTKLPPSSDLIAEDNEFPEAARYLQTLRRVTIPPMTLEMTAIQSVKDARLNVSPSKSIEGGLSFGTVRESLELLRRVSPIVEATWSASTTTSGEWIVTLRYMLSGSDELRTAQWIYKTSGEIRYLDAEAKSLSWMSKSMKEAWDRIKPK